jgi:hypothetical protein
MTSTLGASPAGVAVLGTPFAVKNGGRVVTGRRWELTSRHNACWRGTSEEWWNGA